MDMYEYNHKKTRKKEIYLETGSFIWCICNIILFTKLSSSFNKRLTKCLSKLIQKTYKAYSQKP